MQKKLMDNLNGHFKEILYQILKGFFWISITFWLGIFPGSFEKSLLWAASVTVSTEDPVYRQLDRLEAFGLIKTMIHGQRPYTRLEIARLIHEAMGNYPKLVDRYREDPNIPLKTSVRWLTAKNWIDRTLADLKQNYRLELIEQHALPGKVPTIYGQPMEYAQVDYRYFNERPTQILGENGVGGIAAQRQPFVEFEEGRHYQPGSNWGVETLHWGRFTPYLALQFQPRFQAQMAQSPLESETKFYVHRLNAHTGFGNVDFEIGRDLILWGPSAWGGLDFSRAQRPLDFIKVSSVSPFYYPFFFKNLGINDMSLVIANLGPDQSFENPWLVAYKISNRKAPHLEFSFSQVMLVGGEGSPTGNFGQSVVDFFNMQQNDTRVSRSVLLELIGQIPEARGLQLYSQVSFGDFTSNIGTLLKTNTSYLVGLKMSRLDFAGRFGLRMEYRRLNPRYLRSGLYLDGFTENQRTIGDPLGPESQGVSAWLDYEFNRKNHFNAAFEYRQYGQNFYERQGNNVVRVSNISDEERLLYRVSWQHLFNRNWKGEAFAGLEQVDDFNNIQGQNELFWQAGIQFKIYLDPIAGL